MRVAHLTSVHERGDSRIFLKQCRTLADAGHDVTLVVADGLGNAEKAGVRIADVGRPGGRLNRLIRTTSRVLRCALDIDADVYHLHDPELLPAGLILKRKNKRVIFDAHEDLPRQILSKPYLPAALRWPVAVAAGSFQSFACGRLDAVVAATPTIRDKVARMCDVAVDINNYPLADELVTDMPWSGKRAEVCYVGGISAIRGIRELVAAMALSQSAARLNLAGAFSDSELEADVKAMAGWERVEPLGVLSRGAVRETLARSVAGIVTFLPEPNHIEAQPNKMFEYMSASVPVIASDFPLWREIVEGSACGIVVDPRDAGAIAAAIDRLVNDPELARRLGENGRRAIEERYNWAAESVKLTSLYDRLAARS